MKTIADALVVARSNLLAQVNAAMPARRRGRPAMPETELLAEIKQVIAGQPTPGHRSVHAVIGGVAANEPCCSQSQTHLPYHERAWAAARGTPATA